MKKRFPVILKWKRHIKLFFLDKYLFSVRAKGCIQLKVTILTGISGNNVKIR